MITLKKITRQHWIVFAWPGLILLLALFLHQQGELLALVGNFVFICGVSIGVINALTYLTTSLEIDTQCVRVRRGIIYRVALEIPYNKIESIKIEQSLLAQFLGYGTLIVVGAGGTPNAITPIPHPERLRQRIESLLR